MATDHNKQAGQPYVTVSSRDAAVLLGDANYQTYLREFVRRNKAHERNIFFYVQKVAFKGIANAHHTS